MDLYNYFIRFSKISFMPKILRNIHLASSSYFIYGNLKQLSDLTKVNKPISDSSKGIQVSLAPCPSSINTILPIGLSYCRWILLGAAYSFSINIFETKARQDWHERVCGKWETGGHGGCRSIRLRILRELFAWMEGKSESDRIRGWGRDGDM